MTSVQLLEATQALTSSKKKERLVSLEKIQELLQHDNVVKQLNIDGKESISWDILFIRVHNAVLLEVDRADSKSTNLVDKQLRIMHTIIQEICNKSIYEEVPLLNCDTVISNILSVFESDCRKKYLGCTYFEILSKYILCNRKYWGEIKVEHWIELKNFCKSIFKHPPSSLSSTAILDALCEITRISCKSALACPYFLDLFCFVNSIFTSHRGSLYIIEMSLLRLINILCLQLAVEFRYRVCSFMEEIFDYVLNLHDKKKNSKNCLVYHFLIIYLNVHNPNGINKTEDTFYAYNEEAWKQQVMSIYYFAQKLIIDLLKNNEETELEMGFLDLIVEINYLISSNGFDKYSCIKSNIEIDSYSENLDNSNKRKRSSSSGQSSQSFDRLSSYSNKYIKRESNFEQVMLDPHNPNLWFWLLYLEAMLEKYPQTLRVDYRKYIEFLSKLFLDFRDSKTIQSVCRCLSIILSKEEYYKMYATEIEVSLLNDIWDKIGIEVTRLLQLEESSYHTLMKSLIINSKIRDPGPLLDLYCKGILPNNMNNFFTLLTITQKYTLPEMVNGHTSSYDELPYRNIRLQLLNWLFKERVIFPPKEMSKILITLIVTNTEDENHIYMPKISETLIMSKNINEFFQLIINNYEVVSLNNLQLERDKQFNECPVEPKIDSKMLSELMNFLGNSFSYLRNDLEAKGLPLEEIQHAIRDSLNHCELILWLSSSFMNMNISVENWKKQLDNLKNLLVSCTAKYICLLQNDEICLGPIGNFYSSHYHTELVPTIFPNDSISVTFLGYLFEMFEAGCELNYNECKGKKELCKTEYNEHDDDFILKSDFSNLIKDERSCLHINILPKDQKRVMEVVEILCQYCINGSFSQNECIKRLEVKLCNGLITKLWNLNSNFHLQIVLRIIYNMSKNSRISSETVNIIIKFLFPLFETKKSNSEVVILLLQIMKEFLYLIHGLEHEECLYNFLLLINEFRNVIVVKMKHGKNTVLKFIEFLAAMMKMKWYKTLISDKIKNEVYKLGSEIIAFLKHPYYEVRLLAAQQIEVLFYNPENKYEQVIRRQHEMMNFLKLTLKDERCHTGESENNLLVSSYYKVVGESIALITLAKIICTCSNWRRSTLFYLIDLAFVRKFSENKVKKITTFLGNALGSKDNRNIFLCHLPYLMKRWASAGYEIEVFPYYIWGFRTLKEFLSSYVNIIVPSFLWYGHRDILKTVCNTLSKNQKQVLQDCFSELMGIILPCISENVESKTVHIANKLKLLVNNELSSESTHLIVKNLDKIIFNMFRHIEDNNYLCELTQAPDYFIEEINAISFSVKQVTEALENISQKDGKTLLGEMALERPFVLQKVLNLLTNEVETASLNEDKVIPLCAYVAFVDVLSKATKQSCYIKIVTFLIRDVIYTLIAFMQSYNSKIITDVCLRCLITLVENYITEFSEILGDFLHIITIVCKPLAQRGNALAFDVLKYLICDNFDKLHSAVATLDLFPENSTFKNINSVLENNKGQWNSLKDIIEHFLEASVKKGYAVEGLIYLRQSLTNKKEELKQMYDGLNILRGFSEDCRSSLLHRLICVLIELTADRNILMRNEAAKCLGELGPSDLSTLVLKPENQVIKQRNQSPLYRFLKTCIQDLSDLVTCENLAVKIAASDLLYIILSTSDGSEIMEEDNFEMKKYLLPFLSYPGKTLNLKNNAEKFKNNVNQRHLWIPNEHKDWIKKVTIEILKSFSDSCGMIEAIIQLVQVNWNFAERIFPLILDIILSFNDSVQVNVINQSIAAFFSEYFKKGNGYNSLNTSLNLKSLRCMVNVVDYIRIQRNYDGIYNTFGLKLDYLHVADAARCCSAYFTSILYVELWFHEKKNLGNNVSIDKISEFYPEEGTVLTEILRDCYSKIGISDGVNGCGYMHLLDAATEVQYYEQMNKWNISMLYYDIQLSEGYTNSELHLMNSLYRSGLFYCLKNVIQSNSNSKMDLSNIQYKCASSLSDWNLCDINKLQHPSAQSQESYEKCHYFALKAFHTGDHLSFNNEISKARHCTISKLSSCSIESVQNLYKFLSELRCLKELEDFQLASGMPEVTDLENLYQKWCKSDNIRFNEFKLAESIFVQRLTVIREELGRAESIEKKNFLNSILCEIYYKLIKMARKRKDYQTALRNLNYLNKLENVPDTTLSKIKIEKSLLSWEMGEIDVGKYFLFHYLKNDEIKGDLKVKALRIFGDWMASTNSENSKHIIEQYYLKAIESSENTKERVNCYASLAKFADTNYEQVKEYLSSPLFEIKKNITNCQQDMALELRQEIGWNQDREKKIAYRLVERQSAIDVNEIRNSENQKNLFLTIAIKYYLLSLKEGDKYDLLIFRLISLWFSNLDNADVIKLLKEYLNQIPTYKFLCLLPQIVPRISDIGIISALVERSIRDHPYHTLPLLFALANSTEDAKYCGTRPVPCSQRAVISRAMLEKFRKEQKLKLLIMQMDYFSDAMIELANTSPVDIRPGKSKTAIVSIPPKLKISKLTNLQYVAVPSITIPFRKTCNYEDVIGIKKFENQYQLVGGINIPKKIKCIGLDGINRSLLIKGRDDLRQDAVMQQVFTIMNSLLHRNEDTNKRKLVVRTYKVVPLSQRSGIIEWCENTQPLSLYLVGPDGMSGAHKKFNPNDLTAMECRSRLRQVFAMPDVTNDMKLEVFLDICEKFRPAFCHFFFENFPEPGVWFERRLAYTRSVATSSMIGYILGIGDRHVHNILIDNTTAEVIHIDLGIAFEQGKTLPTPETVPFRLTRDIVDGMGLSGVEGVYRLSCIKTMEVLRENHHTIVTLLEVLLYDPLYSWTLTNEKALHVQGRAGTESSSERNSTELEINKMAERALIRLKQKLQGTEASGIATNSEAQVNYLIQQARDPNNLCRLFHGWQAYL